MRERIRTIRRPSPLPDRTSTQRLRALVPLLLLAFLAAAGVADAAPRAPAMQVGDDGIARALHSGGLTQAEYALERALALVRPDRARRLFGEVDRPDPRAGTAIFRDLAVRLDDLRPAQRAQAARLLARPSSSSDSFVHYRAPAHRICPPRMCFWWVRSTKDAPSLYDGNRNRVPDWVDKTSATFDKVWRTEVTGYGYRKPRSDLSSPRHGPNGKLDIFIADLGSMGLYGYCTSDDPKRGYRRAVSAYCVVDDDFSRNQFQSGAFGVAALRVTAAHEFFHAVQFAYDWREDLWLMEGSATWIEDEVYDGINDNRQYLAMSPISPQDFWHPLDWFDTDSTRPGSLYRYGNWIFFRYLSERYDRDIVRSIWRRADGNAGAPNDYSMKAVLKAVELRGDDLHDVFADFGAANAYPAASYSEGGSYPAPAPAVTPIGPGGLGDQIVPMEHMSNDYYPFTPSGLQATDSVTFELTLPPAVTNPRARALLEAQDGTVTTFQAGFNPLSGKWQIVVPAFGAPTTERVTLVLTNASTRYTCGRRTQLSCRGIPRDDTDFVVAATVTP
jgi:hypothetical protein